MRNAEIYDYSVGYHIVDSTVNSDANSKPLVYIIICVNSSTCGAISVFRWSISEIAHREIAHRKNESKKSSENPN